MSRPRHLQPRPPLRSPLRLWLQSLLRSLSRADCRDRSLSRCQCLSPSRQRPRRLRLVHRDHERRAVVAVAEVVADLVRGR